jgi:hypothetical protein
MCPNTVLCNKVRAIKVSPVGQRKDRRDVMTDKHAQFERVERLLCELSGHTLDDPESTVQVFSYSDELIDFMNSNEAYDPNEAREMLHDILLELFTELASPAQ